MQAYNPKINWKTGEVKIMRCPPICRRSIAMKKKTEKKRKVEEKIRVIEKSEKDK